MTNPLKSERVLVVDGDMILHMAIHAKTDLDHRPKSGEDLNGAYGFLQSLRKYVDKFRPIACFVVFGGGYSDRRKKLFPDYKLKPDRDPKHPAHNKWKADKEVYSLQESRLISILPYFGVHPVRMRGKEADDVLSYMIRTSATPMVLVSEDMDFWQLVSKDLMIFLPRKDKLLHMGNVEENAKVPVNLHLLYKALKGDASDKIPGVHRVGDKTVEQVMEWIKPHMESKPFPEREDQVDKFLDYLFETCSSMETKIQKRDWSRVKNIIESRDIIKRNLGLIDLRLEVLTEKDEEILRIMSSMPFKFNEDMAIRMLGAWDFRPILKSFTGWSQPFWRLR